MSATACSARFSGAVNGAAVAAAQRDQLADHAPARAHRRDQLVRRARSARRRRPSSGRRPGATGVAIERAQQRGAGLVAVGDRDRLQRAVAVSEQADQAGVADQLGHVGGGQLRELRPAGRASEATSSSSPVRSAPNSGSGEKPRALADSEVKCDKR